MTSANSPIAFPARPPRIAMIGLASWDRLIVVDRYPSAGDYEIVRQEYVGPGGTTSNSAIAAAKLGARVAIRALVGDDPEGRALRDALERSGVDTEWFTTVPGQSTDAATIIVSRDHHERTIFWHQGARLVRGDRLDITALYAHDVVLVDVDDPPLRRFLVDLPVHTLPNARLLGTLTYLEDPGNDDAMDVIMRLDAVVGNARQFIAVTSTDTLDEAVASIRERMLGANLRAAVITLGAAGSMVLTRDNLWKTHGYPVDVVDTTGAGDAYAGAIAFAMGARWEWDQAIAFANAVAALSITALGAQSALPTWDETIALMTASHPSRK